MVLPPRLRYGLVRLRALNRPGLWGAGVGVALLVIVVQQYSHHPDWFRPFESASSSPAQPKPGTDWAQFSAEELAGLVEIDNLALLLNQMQPTTTSALTPAVSSSSPPSTNQPGLQLSQPITTQSNPEANPFRAYLDQLQFRGGNDLTSSNGTGWTESRTGAGSPAGASARTSLPSPSTGLGSAQSDPAIAPTETRPLPLSPLQQALAHIATHSSASRDDAHRLGEAGREPAPTPSGLTPPPWMIEGQLPGVNQRFIRTTLEMSPPPGTTGYTVPATLPPFPDSNASRAPGAVTAPAPLDLNFRPAPSTLGSNGGPPSGVASPVLPPSSELRDRPVTLRPEAAPFSVPRPPGSYTGGGYIYTFSDPNGPVD